MRPLVGEDMQTQGGGFGLGALSRLFSSLWHEAPPVVRRLSPDQIGSRIPTRSRRKKPVMRRRSFLERWQRGEAAGRLGVLATLAFFAATGAYGAVLGGRVTQLREGAYAFSSDVTTALGFGIREVRLTGAQRLTGLEMLDLIGVDTGRSLLFFNAQQARQRLLDVSWIKSAQVRKFYPGILAVTLVEREPFALWQNHGVVMLVDQDGTIIGPYDDARFSSLPLVVGNGADKGALALFSTLDQYPVIRSRVRAAVYVAERRWNLKLSDGVEIKLPESNVSAALDQLARLDKENGVLNRHIVSVDLRLADRLTVRLAEDAANKRLEEFRMKAKKPAAVPPAAPTVLAKPGRVT